MQSDSNLSYPFPPSRFLRQSHSRKRLSALPDHCIGDSPGQASYRNQWKSGATHYSSNCATFFLWRNFKSQCELYYRTADNFRKLDAPHLTSLYVNESKDRRLQWAPGTSPLINFPLVPMNRSNLFQCAGRSPYRHRRSSSKRRATWRPLLILLVTPTVWSLPTAMIGQRAGDGGFPEEGGLLHLGAGRGMGRLAGELSCKLLR